MLRLRMRRETYWRSWWMMWNNLSWRWVIRSR
jgi:hypothetical protein